MSLIRGKSIGYKGVSMADVIRAALGVDIGGSHLSCGVVNLARGELDEASLRMSAIDAAASTREILDAWMGPVEAALGSRAEAVITGIGIAMPGPFDYANGISYIRGLNKYESLFGFNIKREFSRRLRFPEDRVLFLNDACCFTLGENWVGAGRGFRRLVGITLGTGFGSAFVSGGKCIEAGRGVPPGGAFWNYPYKDGIAESYFNGRWLLKRYGELSGRTLAEASELAQEAAKNLSRETMPFSTPKEQGGKADSGRKAPFSSALAPDSAEGSPAGRVFIEYAENLAEFLAPWLKEFAAEALIVGGNVARSHQLFLPKLIDNLIENGVRTRVFASALFDKASIIGAAGLLRKFEDEANRPA